VKIEQVQELFDEPFLGDVGKGTPAATVPENGESKPEDRAGLESMSDSELEAMPLSSDKPETAADDPGKPPERFSGKEAILQRLRARTLATRKPKPDP
jgi:hypothetical protein